MKMMLPIVAFFISTAAQAQQFTPPPDKREKVKYAVTRLYISHQCDGRLGMPELYENAKVAFTRALVDAGATIEFISDRIEQLSKIRVEDDGGLALYSREICGTLDKSLRDQIDQTGH